MIRKLLLVLIGLQICSCASQHPAAPQHFDQPIFNVTDEELPAFWARDLNGAVKRLSDYDADLIVLNLWASWCTPCREEMPALVNLQSRFGRRIRVVAIAIDDYQAAVKTFLDLMPVNFPVLLDQQGNIRKLLGVRGLPVTFLVTGQGKLFEISDPDSGQLATKLEGTREWTSPFMIKLIEAILAHQAASNDAALSS